MSEHPSYSTPDTGRDSPPRVPRWVKISGIVAGVLILAVVAVMLLGGGDHGPGRHDPGGDAPADAPAEDGGHRGPFDH